MNASAETFSPEEELIEKELKDLTNIVEAGEQYCYLLTQDVLHDTLKMIEDRYYEAKSIPFAVNSIMNQTLNLLQVILSIILLSNIS
jgi:hypothetical protein